METNNAEESNVVPLVRGTSETQTIYYRLGETNKERDSNLMHLLTKATPKIQRIFEKIPFRTYKNFVRSAAGLESLATIYQGHAPREESKRFKRFKDLLTRGYDIE